MTIPRAVLAAALLTLPAVANHHHALNGTWTLVPADSDFHGETVLQTGTVTINDRERNITVSRDFSYDGAASAASYSFTTDGQENATVRDGKAFKSKASRKSDVLDVTTTRDGVTTVEHFSSTASGTLMLTAEQAGHQPLTLVFHRR
jgi:hypothetical protein